MKWFNYLFFYLFSIHSFSQCWRQVSAASYNVGYHNSGIQSDGTLWTWGLNADGQLGDGTTTTRLVPTQVGTATDWVWVSAGTDATYAIKEDGTLWAWGNNRRGQLADGTTTSRLLPAQVQPGTIWMKVSAGQEYVIAQKTDGTLWASGYNVFGQLGVNGQANAYNFMQVNTDVDWLDFKVGFRQTVLLKNDFTYWCWGEGTQGVLGTGSDIGSDPISPLLDTDWSQVTTGFHSTLFRKSNGTLWGVGFNGVGTLGQGNYNNVYYTVQQIGTANNWRSIESCTNHTMAIKNDGTLWACGYNGNGQLGNGTTANTNILAQIGTASNWAKVRCGRLHTLAVDDNGRLWAWGDNTYGQLGDGTTTNRLTPSPIGAYCNLSNDSFTKNIMQLLSNPVNDFVKLSFAGDSFKEIEIYNTLGRLIDVKKISDDFLTINVSGYSKGIYFVLCKYDNISQTIKFVKN